MPSTSDYDKEALRLVALDRQLAGAVVVALRSWSRTKKATGRTYKALMFAGAIAGAMERTTVSAQQPRQRRSRSTT